jgi:magnesium transporter
MNFHDMPELSWPHAYPIAGAITILSTLALVVWLRMRHWL